MVAHGPGQYVGIRGPGGQCFSGYPSGYERCLFRSFKLSLFVSVIPLNL